MPKNITCGNCGAVVSLEACHLNQDTRCPRCGGVLIASDSQPVCAASLEPGATSAPKLCGSSNMAHDATDVPAPSLDPWASCARAELQARLLGAFRGNIEPVKTTLAYKLGLVLVCAVMVLLVAVYIGLILALAWLLYRYALSPELLLVRVGGIWLYLGVVVGGPVLLLFLVKPLFAPPARTHRLRSLVPQQEPVLFSFLERISAALGAPRPKRVDVDCQPNASASFRRGIWSILAGDDLVLTIGVPMAAGLNASQFAGVLAHELGHFAQGTGMRMTSLVRAISFWFTRVVYERDKWDARLARWAQVGWVGQVLVVAIFLVWLTRKVLWGLMIFGHAVAAAMMRQMELDADRHEMRLVGSRTFQSTCQKMTLLELAEHWAMSDLDRFYSDGRLPDDLPRLILANLKLISPEDRQKVDQLINNSTTGWFDTHPSLPQRIAAARRENAPGIFHLDMPASALFSDFDALCRNVTCDVYQAALGEKFKPERLHPVEELLARGSVDLDAYESLKRFFQGSFYPLRPLQVPSAEELYREVAVEEAVGRLKQSREAMLAGKTDYDAAFRLFDQCDTKTLGMAQAEALLQAGFTIKKEVFGFPVEEKADIDIALWDAQTRVEELLPRLQPFEQAAQKRILAALQLLHSEDVAAKMDDPTGWRQEAAAIMPVLQAIAERFSDILQLRNQHAALAALLGQVHAHQDHALLMNAIRSHMRLVYQKAAELSDVFGALPYPFDHAAGQISVIQYIVEAPPVEDDCQSIYQWADGFMQKLCGLHVRMMARLCLIAEQVESAVGLPLLPDPPQPETPA